MKKSKKIIIIISIILVIAAICGIIFWNTRNNNKLTTNEKKYLANNINTVQNISILNNVNILGDEGIGVFYDFINDFSHEYSITFNNVTYNLGEANNNPLAFTSGNTLNDNEFAFYEDHYVLLGRKYEYINDIDKIHNMKVGVLADSLSYISSYISNNVSFNTYKSNEELFKSFSEQQDINYIIVPLNNNLDTILSKNFSILYHFGDMKYYFKLAGDKNNPLSEILKKYYLTWKENKFNNYYQKYLLDLFSENLKISQTEIDAMKSISYNYGMMDYSPLEILTGGNYGGIIAQIMSEFKSFSGIDLKFTKYKNEKRYLNAVNKGSSDIYFNFFNSSNNYNSIHSGIPINYEVLVHKKDSRSLNSLTSLKDEEVYVYANTVLYSMLSSFDLNLKPYKDIDELKKAVKQEKIVIMDSTMYTAYQNNVLDKYSSRYSGSFDSDYVFKVSTNDTFNKLLQNYINIKDSKEIINKGIYNHDLTYRTGTITGTIARYFMYILIIFIATFLYIYKVTKKVKISKKIKKDDKLKYIDQLTSLKNRNYLSENMEAWDKNTVYPQTIIVVGLNNLGEINDTISYEQGDEQIRSAANILVKNQLDKSDIMRTDGNEFVIYLVGYAQKQITSYIHKLNREFKHLPHDYGASIGYSMITDDVKSIEDAINEALEDVNKQKNSKKEEL